MFFPNTKGGFFRKKMKEQAGAELCQAQFKLGQAKTEIFFNIIENWDLSSI